MRLIDADDRIEFIKNAYCPECDNYNGVRCRACPINDMIEAIDDAPTIDPWHYPSKGDNPHVTGSYLVFSEGENGLQYAIGEYFAEENRKRWMNANEWHLELDGVSGTFDPIAWMPLPEPPKEEA